MTKTPITWLGIAEIIEGSLFDNTPFCFVCDKLLAYAIAKYIEFEFDIADECEDSFESDEYYVSVLPCYENIPAQMFVEPAKLRSGIYKLSEVEDMRYYIFNNIDEESAKAKLCGGSYTFYTLVHEDDVLDYCEDKCDCGYCDDDSIQEEAKIIAECLHSVFEDKALCIDCKIAKIVNLAYLFKSVGYTEAKDTFRAFIEGLD